MTFREKVEGKKFIITVEVAPPRGTNVRGTLSTLKLLKGKVDAFNVTDNQRSFVRMSSFAMSRILLDNDFEPIMQLTARDRNRMGIQSDLLGAFSLGIKNICLMTGDFTTLGDEKGAKPVFDVDSVQLIRIARTLNEGYLINGKELDGRTDFLIGAVFNPFAEPKELQIMKLRKKIKEGAKFIQTQPIYDLKLARHVSDVIADFGAIPIIGILPIRSLRMLNFMKKLNPNSVPDNLIKGIEEATNPLDYGWRYAVDLVHSIAEFGMGVHFMLAGNLKQLSRLVDYLRDNHKGIL